MDLESLLALFTRLKVPVAAEEGGGSINMPDLLGILLTMKQFWSADLQNRDSKMLWATSCC